MAIHTATGEASDVYSISLNTMTDGCFLRGRGASCQIWLRTHHWWRWFKYRLCAVNVSMGQNGYCSIHILSAAQHMKIQNSKCSGKNLECEEYIHPLILPVCDAYCVCMCLCRCWNVLNCWVTLWVLTSGVRCYWRLSTQRSHLHLCLFLLLSFVARRRHNLLHILTAFQLSLQILPFVMSPTCVFMLFNTVSM